MNYRSIAHLSNDVRSWSATLPRDLDLIVGVPRSGMLPANMVALYRNLPLTDLQGLLEGRLLSSGPRGGQGLTEKELRQGRCKILVLDDCVSTGRAMREVYKQIAPLQDRHNILVGAIYSDPKADIELDVQCTELHMPYLFEWNIMHSWGVEHGCLDMDGVLCRDPDPHQDDDGPAYRQFLKEAAPYLLPTKRVARIVTCRLEKYRAETEQWLADHGVEYEQLTMMQSDAAARDADRRHGAYKAEVYRSKNRYQLFIESSLHQARQIAKWSGKPVFCVETMEMLVPGTHPFQSVDAAPHDYHTGLFNGRVKRVARKATGYLRATAHETRTWMRALTKQWQRA
ncbi:MAG: hypothetical protein PPP56_05245 [Longimonas sp.]|uniref:orotate phosphoribosyltransferase n=1 Tax=Longimonas sp. TaxID=2039626 RepID=UPI00335CD473